MLHLYNESGKNKRKELRQNIAEYKKSMLNADNAERIQENIEADANVLETIGSCKFYCISTYYLFQERFDVLTNHKTFDYDRYYDDKIFKENLVNDYINLFIQYFHILVC